MNLDEVLDSDTGDPLWVPRTFRHGWPASVPPAQQHLLSPELLTIQRARATSAALRRDPARGPEWHAAW